MSATEIVTYSQSSTGFGPFKCSKRTAAHLDYTKQLLKQRHPGTILVIIQGCYHTGLDVSEGTHDRDCCLDVRIVGLTWQEAQAFLRSCGWAAWWRRTWQGPWAEHIHMISLGFAPYHLPVGVYIDGGLSKTGVKYTSSQVEDYFNHSWGLAGMHNSGADTSWFPPDIMATIFDYEAWTREQEDWFDMATEAQLRAIVKEEIAAAMPTTDEIKSAVMQAKINNAGTTVKSALELDYRTNSAATATKE